MSLLDTNRFAVDGVGVKITPFIKSIQTLSKPGWSLNQTTFDFSISTVNINKSIILTEVRQLGGSGDSGNIPTYVFSASFLSNNTVRIERFGTSSNSFPSICYVIEFENIVNIYSGSASASGFDDISAIISLPSTVDLNKSMCFSNFKTSGDNQLAAISEKVWFIDSTSIQIHLGNAGTSNNRLLNWYVVEFP